MRSWGDDISKYKGKAQYGDVLLNYLDEKHQEQADSSVVPEGLLETEEPGKGYPW